MAESLKRAGLPETIAGQAAVLTVMGTAPEAWEPTWKGGDQVIFARTKQNPAISRRALLAACGAAATAPLAGCDLLSTDPVDEDGGESTPKGPEAPALAAQVKAGDLPQVAERLPAEPLVIEPTERIGTYGGTLRNALVGVSNAGQIYTRAAYENLVRWTEKWTGATGSDEIIPNVAESFEVNADGTEYTFRLRRGMRWSDGEPFTADDVVFAVDDVLLNRDLFPATPTWLVVDEGVGGVEKLDDYAFKIVFPGTAGIFLNLLATYEGHYLTHFPRHYLEEFHKDYNADVESLASAEGFAGWVEFFGSKSGPGANFGEAVDLPSLAAWQLVTSFVDGDQQLRLERNPYYWKADPDGSQLPYIDELVFDQVNDLELLLVKALNGEIDLDVGPDTRFTTLANKPVLAGERETAGYRFLDLVDTRMNVLILYFNLTHADEVKREIFGNKDFRIGLSHAINRDELSAAALQGRGEPYQVAPLSESPFYDEEFATQYLEYDVDLANEFLDRAFPDRNADGVRLGPDDNPISFTIEYVADHRAEWVAMMELVERYWRDVGVDVHLKNVSRELMLDRTLANQHDATVWQGDAGLSMLVAPHYYIGTQEYYGSTWSLWYESGGTDGEEPPEAPRRQMQLYDRLKSTADADQQAELMREILAIGKEEFYHIGTIRETETYTIASTSIHNLPKTMLQGWDYPTPGPTRPEQYFMADS